MRAQDIFDLILGEARMNRDLAKDENGELVDSDRASYALGLYRAAEIIAKESWKEAENE